MVCTFCRRLRGHPSRMPRFPCHRAPSWHRPKWGAPCTPFQAGSQCVPHRTTATTTTVPMHRQAEAIHLLAALLEERPDKADEVSVLHLTHRETQQPLLTLSSDQSNGLCCGAPHGHCMSHAATQQRRSRAWGSSQAAAGPRSALAGSPVGGRAGAHPRAGRHPRWGFRVYRRITLPSLLITYFGPARIIQTQFWPKREFNKIFRPASAVR